MLPVNHFPISSVSTGVKQLYCPTCGYIALFDQNTWNAYSGPIPNASVYLWPTCPYHQSQLLNASGKTGGIPGDGQ
jgi:hypothetical protein